MSKGEIVEEELTVFPVSGRFGPRTGRAGSPTETVSAVAESLTYSYRNTFSGWSRWGIPVRRNNSGRGTGQTESCTGILPSAVCRSGLGFGPAGSATGSFWSTFRWDSLTTENGRETLENG